MRGRIILRQLALALAAPSPVEAGIGPQTL
jgi:hypothetical protein